MALIATKPAFLILICALAYGLSAVALKHASISPGPAIYAAIAVCFGVAAITEIALLRQLDLGFAYVAIIGAESVLVISFAAMIGEGFGPREAAGAGLVLAGTFLLTA